MMFSTVTKARWIDAKSTKHEDKVSRREDFAGSLNSLVTSSTFKSPTKKQSICSAWLILVLLASHGAAGSAFQPSQGQPKSLYVPPDLPIDDHGDMARSNVEKFRSLFQSVKVAPSPIDGQGLFLRSSSPSMTRGQTFRTTDQKLGMMALGDLRFGMINSPLTPPWFEVFGNFSRSASAEDDPNQRVRQMWLEYVEKEEGLANVWTFHKLKEGLSKLSPNEMPVMEMWELVFLKDLSGGQELLRAYGNECLVDKFASQVTLLFSMKKELKTWDRIQRYRFCVSRKNLLATGARWWADTPNSFPIGTIIHEEDGEAVVVSVDDIFHWAETLYYLITTVAKHSNDPKFEEFWAIQRALLEAIGFTDLAGIKKLLKDDHVNSRDLYGNFNQRDMIEHMMNNRLAK